jgi:hypothetical protein
MRKMVHIGTASFDALTRLAKDKGQTFQDVMDEAIADLLKKHKRPVTLKDMLSGSLVQLNERRSARKRP